MKKQIKILILAIILVISSAITVNAADATVSLSSETQARPGDTFIVTLSAAYEEGINGIEATVSYDENKLSISNLQIVNTLNWSVLNEEVEDGLNLAILCNSSNKITTADILKIEFKVKETASVGTTEKISLKDITIDGDTANSTKELGTQEIEVSIVEEQTTNPPTDDPTDDPADDPAQNPSEKTLTSIELTKTPTKTTYTAGEKFDKTGMEVVAKYSDGSKMVITDYKITNGNQLKAGQTSIIISYTEGNVTKNIEQKITVVEKSTNNNEKDEQDKKPTTGNTQKDDNTKTENKIPDTGVYSVLGIMVVVAGFGVVGLVKYNKYREI